ncbi:MAG TPA: radical SAM protein [Acidobacteria bacterium]|nr:radical SAM protein [Acidobacteriota bacterium]
MERRTLRRALPLAGEAATVWLRYNFVEPLRSTPSLPRAMHYISTHRCNARCAMCGIWKNQNAPDEELSPEGLRAILGDRLFARMEYFGLSGGEPFLRRDLVELVVAILESCTRLKRLSITTNGLLPERVERTLPAIASRCRKAGVLLDVSVSVHGMDEVLDRIYGVPGAFDRIERTTGTLARMRAEGALTFSFNCVLLAGNLDSVRRLQEWARQREIPIAFVMGEQRERFFTEGLEEAFLDPAAGSELLAFLSERAEDPSLSAVQAEKYRELVRVLEGRGPRRLSCYYAMGGLLLGFDGRLYYCSHSREIGDCTRRSAYEIYTDPANLKYRRRELFGAECRTCPPYTRTRWEIEKDLPRMLLASLRRRIGRPAR